MPFFLQSLNKAFESYNGTKMFSIHLVDTIKNMVSKSKDCIVSNVSIEEKLERYLSFINVESQQSNILNCLASNLNLIGLIGEEQLKEYVYLKFGYYKGINFNDSDITKILNIPMESAKQLYGNSLLVLKEELNKKIDSAILYSSKEKDKRYQKKG